MIVFIHLMELTQLWVAFDPAPRVSQQGRIASKA